MTPDNPAYVEAPPYRVAEATKDGMSANLWRGSQHTHTIWCPTADAANEAAHALAQALNHPPSTLDLAADRMTHAEVSDG